VPALERELPTLTAQALASTSRRELRGATTADLTGPREAASRTAVRPRASTSLVSVGIGGNDLGYSTIAANCAATRRGPTKSAGAASRTTPRRCRPAGGSHCCGGRQSVGVLADIRSGRARRVFVIGYPTSCPTGSAAGRHSRHVDRHGVPASCRSRAQLALARRGRSATSTSTWRRRARRTAPAPRTTRAGSSRSCVAGLLPLHPTRPAWQAWPGARGGHARPDDRLGPSPAWRVLVGVPSRGALVTHVKPVEYSTGCLRTATQRRCGRRDTLAKSQHSSRGSRGIGEPSWSGSHVTRSGDFSYLRDDAAARWSLGARGRGSAWSLKSDQADTGDVGVCTTRGIQWRGLDIVVNNARSHWGPPGDTTDEEFDSVMAANVKGTFASLREAARRLRDGDGSSMCRRSTPCSTGRHRTVRASKGASNSHGGGAHELGPRGIT